MRKGIILLILINLIPIMIKEYFLMWKVISEGLRSKDKILIFLWNLLTPLQFFFPELNKKLGPILLRKDYGVIKCFGDSLYMASNVHERKIKNYLDRVGTFIDVGSGIGKYTLEMAGKSRKVIAIEPDDKYFELLKQNLHLNGIENVKLYTQPCYKEITTKKFYLRSLSLSSLDSFIPYENEIEMETITLDEIVAIEDMDDVDLIKIDVEGFEPEVIEGAEQIIKSSQPKIIFEAPSDKKLKEIEKKLGCRYQIKKIDRFNYFAKPSSR